MRCITSSGKARSTILPGTKNGRMGILTFLDPPRPDTKGTLESAIALGVDVKMITGDHLVRATVGRRTVVGLAAFGVCMSRSSFRRTTVRPTARNLVEDFLVVVSVAQSTVVPLLECER